MGEMGKLVDKFFNIMIHSKPMKQAMIIDKEANKYKYFFNNENILKEFNENVNLVPLPFQNYFGFTDIKSFDIYINISYKTYNDFSKVLEKYNIFFINKSHEFKHASRIYLRIYDENVKIKPTIKDIKGLKKKRSYLQKIFDNTQNNLNILFSANNPKGLKKLRSKINKYGDLLELSLFGYKLEDMLFKCIIFCLSESSWNLSPEDFYHLFSMKMMDNKIEKLDDLCKGNFLKELLKFYSFAIKGKEYANEMISKKSNERQSHIGLRELNLGKKIMN